ncbi:MAG: hypothetical protein WAN71_00580 [Mycobacterium sp.]
MTTDQEAELTSAQQHRRDVSHMTCAGSSAQECSIGGVEAVLLDG